MGSYLRFLVSECSLVEQEASARVKGWDMVMGWGGNVGKSWTGSEEC